MTKMLKGMYRDRQIRELLPKWKPRVARKFAERARAFRFLDFKAEQVCSEVCTLLFPEVYSQRHVGGLLDTVKGKDRSPKKNRHMSVRTRETEVT